MVIQSHPGATSHRSADMIAFHGQLQAKVQNFGYNKVSAVNPF